jgi:hypothetical protein|tara:strand:+ start:1008 stop:1181 length:174 start_codon:yes stop_codon:yes gene_type:complete
MKEAVSPERLEEILAETQIETLSTNQDKEEGDVNGATNEPGTSPEYDPDKKTADYNP